MTCALGPLLKVQTEERPLAAMLGIPTLEKWWRGSGVLLSFATSASSLPKSNFKWARCKGTRHSYCWQWHVFAWLEAQTTLYRGSSLQPTAFPPRTISRITDFDGTWQTAIIHFFSSFLTFFQSGILNARLPQIALSAFQDGSENSNSGFLEDKLTHVPFQNCTQYTFILPIGSSYHIRHLTFACFWLLLLWWDQINTLNNCIVSYDQGHRATYQLLLYINAMSSTYRHFICTWTEKQNFL